MQTVTIIVNGAPYGTEGPYNALRLATALVSAGAEVRIFLMADAVCAAKRGQKVPKGYYNLEDMLVDVIGKGAPVSLCATCANARGIASADIVEGAVIGGMMDLARWIIESDKVISF